jgi:hypothetical protein
LPTVLRDRDGIEDERRGIISVFDGPPPEVMTFPYVAAEAEAVRAAVATWLGEGIAAHEIGLLVRTPELVVRPQAAIDGLARAAEIVTAQMSLAKGLEFCAIVVMDCDQGSYPSTSASPTQPTKPRWTTSTRPSGDFSMSPARGPANTCC